MLNGIDISHWQKSLDLTKIDFDFVIIKATQGKKRTDECFKKFADTALMMNKKIGLYHYFSNDGTPEEQAEHFINTIKDYIGIAVLVLDWEAYNNENYFFKGQEIAVRFLNYVYFKTGVKPIIYMSVSVTRDYKWDKVINGSYGLWIAQYKDKKEINGFVENPWRDKKGIGDFPFFAIHQYTSKGLLKGYPFYLDLDKAYMTKNAWEAYAKVRHRT